MNLSDLNPTYAVGELKSRPISGWWSISSNTLEKRETVGIEFAQLDWETFETFERAKWPAAYLK